MFFRKEQISTFKISLAHVQLKKGKLPPKEKSQLLFLVSLVLVTYGDSIL